MREPETRWKRDNFPTGMAGACAIPYASEPALRNRVPKSIRFEPWKSFATAFETCSNWCIEKPNQGGGRSIPDSDAMKGPWKHTSLVKHRLRCWFPGKLLVYVLCDTEERSKLTQGLALTGRLRARPREDIYGIDVPSISAVLWETA